MTNWCCYRRTFQIDRHNKAPLAAVAKKNLAAIVILMIMCPFQLIITSTWFPKEKKNTRWCHSKFWHIPDCILLWWKSGQLCRCQRSWAPMPRNVRLKNISIWWIKGNEKKITLFHAGSSEKYIFFLFFSVKQKPWKKDLGVISNILFDSKQPPVFLD